LIDYKDEKYKVLKKEFDPKFNKLKKNIDDYYQLTKKELDLLQSGKMYILLILINAGRRATALPAWKKWKSVSHI